MAAIKITKDSFQSEVLNSEIPVMVDFWAAWCGPCKMLGPIIEEISDEADGRFKVCKVNVDDEKELAAQFGIMTIPTVIIFKNGKEEDKLVGVRGKDEFIKALL